MTMTQEEKDQMKHLAYQMGIGALMTIGLIAACSIGQLLNSIY